jgi:hypothetical protein
VLVCVNHVPNYVLVCEKSCFKMLYLKLCLNREEGEKEKKYRPAGADPRRKRTRGQKQSFLYPQRDVNGCSRILKSVAPLEMP